MTIKSFRHVGIVTSNIDASISFYGDLGFSVYWDQNETSGFINTILGDNFTITSQNITHISVDTEDIDKLYLKYSQLFKSKPQLTNDRKAKVAFMKDPNNNMFIEIVEMV